MRNPTDDKVYAFICVFDELKLVRFDATRSTDVPPGAGSLILGRGLRAGLRRPDGRGPGDGLLGRFIYPLPIPPFPLPVPAPPPLLPSLR